MYKTEIVSGISVKDLDTKIKAKTAELDSDYEITGLFQLPLTGGEVPHVLVVWSNEGETIRDQIMSESSDLNNTLSNILGDSSGSNGVKGINSKLSTLITAMNTLNSKVEDIRSDVDAIRRRY